MTTEQKKKPKQTQKIYSLEEEEMQELVSTAQSGDSIAQARLIQVFDNFLSKYVALLYHGKLDLENANIRKFLALYMLEKKLIFGLINKKLNKHGMSVVNETLQGIHYMVQRYGDEEDVRQSVELSFLQAIMKYTRKESSQGGWVPFSGFLNNYYHYLLKKNVDEFLIDQLGRKTFPLIYEANHEGDIEIQQGFEPPPVPGIEETLGPDDIDEFWVAGETALYPFDLLTIQDRQLLKWKYIDGKKSSQISQLITEHSNTTRENLHKIRRKLVSIMAEDIDVHI